ncbi:sensor histidine kinase [Zavarzinella formosa]|uniref:sensor histidine kinase n=1 Tax=Zavarzinella formosa TaxID=360055 RepID=UPI0002E9F793|nr:ATP-binding protein [Zavarzinella formosa]
MTQVPEADPLSRWDLAAEAIAVRIRWFGLVVGFSYVNIVSKAEDTLILNGLLLMGLAYTVVDTWTNHRGRVMLAAAPILVSAMETFFIGLLCYFENDLESPFRNFYLLSLLCCAIRQTVQMTLITFVLHTLSYGLVYLILHQQDQSGMAVIKLFLLLAVLTWASIALSRLIKGIGEHLSNLNSALRENQTELENRIAERTRELQETQAQLMHQDKMAGFGLLAAGIAHEVGNPLTSISSIVQVLERKNPDDYTRDKLSLVGGQLSRIQGILRELTNFSRPPAQEKTRYTIKDIVEEAMNIVKYYKGTKSRTLSSDIPADLPILHGVRDQLVQVIFNLVLNAIDATAKGGRIDITAFTEGNMVVLSIRDDGNGIDPNNLKSIFQPYFTTKKQGTGLGLFVTNKIIGEHGGNVTFLSAPKQGTTFLISLPFSTNDKVTR